MDYVQSKGHICLDGLRELVDEFEQDNKFCQDKKVHISDNILKAFLDGMDLDGNRVLDAEEMIGVINRKKLLGSQ